MDSNSGSRPPSYAEAPREKVREMQPASGGFHNPAMIGHNNYGRMTSDNPPVIGQNNYARMTTSQPGSEQSIVMMPGQMPEAMTMGSLILSTLTTIFCFIWCGAAAILLTWQARMQILDKKFQHARHSLNVAKIFNGIAFFLGLIFWSMLIYYMVLLFGALRR